MRDAIIHYENEPFTARIVGETDEPVELTPIVYDAPTNCGLGIRREGGQGSVWGMVTPRNLIAAWRGTEVLRLLDTIEHGTLCNAYNTGVRDPHSSDIERHVDPTIAKIGQAEYNRIMSLPVPETIIRAILDHQDDDFAPALYPITDEVRAGTIEWRQEFDDVGISHPDAIDAKKRAQEETVAKFERLLVSYAGARKLERECNGMWNVEGALLTLVEKGVDQEHPDHVLVALAGVVADLATSEFAMSIMPFGPRDQASYDAQMDRTREEAFARSAEWLSESSGARAAWWQFWKTDEGGYSRDGALELLKRLLDEYFPPKSKTAEA
jgi:hypothetical protein